MGNRNWLTPVRSQSPNASVGVRRGRLRHVRAPSPVLVVGEHHRQAHADHAAADDHDLCHRVLLPRPFGPPSVRAAHDRHDLSSTPHRSTDRWFPRGADELVPAPRAPEGSGHTCLRGEAGLGAGSPIVPLRAVQLSADPAPAHVAWCRDRMQPVTLSVHPLTAREQTAWGCSDRFWSLGGQPTGEDLPAEGSPRSSSSMASQAPFSPVEPLGPGLLPLSLPDGAAFVKGQSRKARDQRHSGGPGGQPGGQRPEGPAPVRNACFSAGAISAKVRPSPSSGTKTGS